MLYASTATKNYYGTDYEEIVVLYPLSEVPGLDQNNMPEHTYLVPDDVELHWVRDTTQPGVVWVPPPEPPEYPDPEPPPPIVYLGELTLETATGGLFDAESGELNAVVGQTVTVTGTITDAAGDVMTMVSMPNLRLPILPTNLWGYPIHEAQPGLALVSIVAGVVTATWTPEYTGTYEITEAAVNVRLPDAARLKFGGLQIFVLPAAPELTV